MRNLILILSNRDEGSVEPVVNQLEDLGEKFYRFNTEEFPLGTSLTISLSRKVISSFGEDPVDLERIKSVWYRRPAPALITDQKISKGYARFITNESKAALWSLYTTIDAFWMNPPLFSTRLLEQNKLYQLKEAFSVGLEIPDTIITNNPKELLDFCEKHGGTIAVKLLRGDWFVKSGTITTLFVLTQKVASTQIAECFEDIKLSPVFGQEYVEKELELRVTIVGEKVFTCAIYSQASEQTKVDWRNYDFENVKHELYQLPREIEEKLLILMRRWRLSYGAIDMILTPDGRYVFLEINANGQWFWIEQLIGVPISRTIAELLAGPS